MDLDKWKSQLRKGVIEFVLLLFLQNRKRAYGLEIIEGLLLHGMPITEGTLYPLLSRLTEEKILAPKWETENMSGHPRKYYQLTDKGHKVLHMMQEQWQDVCHTLTSLKKES